MTLAELNALDRFDAEREFLRCCGSTQWARMMSTARPFITVEAMMVTADVIWAALDRADWLEAFAAHPPIGAAPAGEAGQAGAPAATPRGVPSGVSVSSGRGWGPAASAKNVDADSWSAQEQAGAANASDDVRDRLARGNCDYLARFGYIFIVCATGKSAGEMLAILERRLSNDPEQEIAIAAEEQRKITRLRLAKLAGAGQVSTT